MKPIHINAKTISDAWFQLLYNLPDYAYRQDIQKGSFEQVEYRLQYPSVSVFIEYPYFDVVPVIPVELGIPSPTSMDSIENYFMKYLLDPNLSEHETYKYSTRILHPIPVGSKGDRITQLDYVIELLKYSPFTNQAIIEVGHPEDHWLCKDEHGHVHPPCLRLLDFKVIKSRQDNVDVDNNNSEDLLYLTVSCYFRSWDLWAGFPTNLGGIELLKQYVLEEIKDINTKEGRCIKNGPIYAYSSGLHIYGYQKELVKIRTYRSFAI